MKTLRYVFDLSFLVGFSLFGGVIDAWEEVFVAVASNNIELGLIWVTLPSTL